jgi:hypothetical protein
MEVKAVENLLMVGEFPVDGSTRKKNSPARASEFVSTFTSLPAFVIRFA